MDDRPDSSEEIDHTADWAIRVRASGLPGLFTTAARGMFGLLCELSGVDTSVETELALEAPDMETLLVDWLNELLFLAGERRAVFHEFTIEMLQPGPPARLRARARGGPAPQLHKQIKAATFHDLRIEARGTGVEATLVFDV